jgi:60 kDa SS-A/Ro ribonucleoprotein
VNILVAARTYASGRSMRGSGEWTPKRQIIDALDAAFYAAFATVESAGKRTLIALDVSGSMTWYPISGMPLTPREASAALALVTLATEPSVDVVGFCHGGWTAPNDVRRSYSAWGAGIRELSISPRQRLDDVIGYVSDLPAGGTDVALPFRWAQAQGRDYDTVITFTDNETWSGDQHPHQALNAYRGAVGHDVRQVIVAMTANDVSVGDPLDPHSLDVAGFDSAAPNLIADFSRGDV